MNILFVSSRNRLNEISPIVFAQAQSLVQIGLEISYYPISGKGIIGYARNILPLRRLIANNSFDLVHAHYSLSGVISSLSTNIPLVVSLMGSDIFQDRLYLWMARSFTRFRWNKTIVKSSGMFKRLKVNKVIIIPNGVNMDKYIPMDRREACNKVGFNPEQKNILFLADPLRSEKNYQLAESAIAEINSSDIKLHCVHNRPTDDIPYYLNASDLLLLTSDYEGSPNSVKEALSCNTPVVSTDVGDVKDLIQDMEGCFIAAHAVKDIADKIIKSLSTKKSPDGRRRIIERGLDSGLIAKELYKVYNEVIAQND